MSDFDRRGKAFEARYQLDQDQLFKVQNRRNRLLGQWVGDLLGKSGGDLEAYAAEVVRSDFDKPGDSDIVAKVMGDLGAKGVDLSEAELRRKMDELLAEARRQVIEELKR